MEVQLRFTFVPPLFEWSISPAADALAQGSWDFALVCALLGCYGDNETVGRSRMTPETPNLPDDVTLVRAVGAGDRAAFQQLYERHGSILFSLALKILTSRSDAEDVLQETFFQVWKTAPGFDQQRGKPLGWLIMLTRSRAIDRLRSRQTRTRAMQEAAHETPGDIPSPEQEAGAAETRAQVRQAVVGLPSEVRQPIELAYFSGLTQTEIAAQLGQPLGTVKTRMRAGMSRLREQLGSVGGTS